MTDLEERAACASRCWYIGIGIGVLLWLVLWLLTSWTFFQSLFAGIVVAIILGWLLGVLLCKSQDNGASASSATAASATAAGAAAAAAGVSAKTAPDQDVDPETGLRDVAAPMADTDATSDEAKVAEAETLVEDNQVAEAAKAFEMQPSKKLPGQEELAARKGDWKYEKPGAEAAPAADEPAVDRSDADAEKEAREAAKAARVEKRVAKRQAARAAEEAAAEADSSASGEVAESQPEVLAAAREGGADDLKLISGVGPKLEGTLNDLGFYHFDQIAKWGASEVAWVDSRLRFKGRIERDNWIDQAKILAAGGETEFSKRKKT